MEKTNNMLNKYINNKKQETEEAIKKMDKMCKEKERKEKVEESKLKIEKEKNAINQLKIEDDMEVEFDENGNIINDDD
jgi:hypothetical protein